MPGYAILTGTDTWSAVTKQTFDLFNGEKQILFCDTFDEATDICVSLTAEQKQANEAMAFELSLNQ